MMAQRLEVEDIDLIRDVVTMPEIWETVAEDGQEPDNFQPDFIHHCWLKIVSSGVVIALWQFKPVNKITLDVHPYVLPAFRGKVGKAAGIEHLKWIYDHGPQYQKLVASIPVIYKHVKIYANMLGYKDEGLNRCSYLKNDKVHDQWILGITRNEISERCLSWAE